MNEEIKEIFNEIKHLVEISNYKKHYHLNVYFEVEHIDKLLNYITNLQEENQKLNKIIDELEKWLEKEANDKYYGTDKTVSWGIYYKNVLNKLTELKKDLFKEKI